MTEAAHETYVADPEHSVLERASAELDAKMEYYVHDPDMRELILATAEARGIELEGDIEDEASFMEAAQAALDFRNGQGRSDIKATDLNERTLAALDKVVEKEKM